MSDRPKWTPPTPRADGKGCAWCGEDERLYVGDAGERFCSRDHETWFRAMEKAARDLYEALAGFVAAWETHDAEEARVLEYGAFRAAHAALAKARGE